MSGKPFIRRRAASLFITSLLALAVAAPAVAQSPGPTSVRSFTPGNAATLFGEPSGWSAASPIPSPDAGHLRYAHAQCPDTPNSFYIISGVTASLSLSTQAWRYDADTDTWNELAPIPTGQEGLSATCHGNHIYVTGGGGTNQFYI